MDDVVSPMSFSRVDVVNAFIDIETNTIFPANTSKRIVAVPICGTQQTDEIAMLYVHRANMYKLHYIRPPSLHCL